MLRLLLLDVSALNDDRLFQTYFSLLSPVRQEKVSAFRLRKDKNLSLGAGLLLDHVLREQGRTEREMSYDFGKSGKPAFRELPELQFNLSHSGTKVLGAFSNRPVGCDIEQLAEANLAVAKRFFAPMEYERLLHTGDRAELFFRIWTAKESFLKCTGEGLTRPPESVCLHFGETVSVETAPGFCFHEYGFEDYRAACCCTGSEPRPEPEYVQII